MSKDLKSFQEIFTAKQVVDLIHWVQTVTARRQFLTTSPEELINLYGEQNGVRYLCGSGIIRHLDEEHKNTVLSLKNYFPNRD